MSHTRKITRSMLRGSSLAPECMEANTSPAELAGPGWEAVGCYGLWEDGIPDLLDPRCRACPACVWNWDGMYSRVRQLLEGVVPW